MPESEMDVFTAAAALKDLWNSDARAVSADTIEWMCTTWGSSRGGCTFTYNGQFLLAAELFGLATSRNWDGRDELIVDVPLGLVPAVIDLVERLEDPGAWPWRTEEDPEQQIAIAACCRPRCLHTRRQRSVHTTRPGCVTMDRRRRGQNVALRARSGDPSSIRVRTRSWLAAAAGTEVSWAVQGAAAIAPVRALETERSGE